MTRIRIDDLDPLQTLSPEEMAQVLGAGRGFFRPSLEGLEARELPAPVSSVAVSARIIFRPTLSIAQELRNAFVTTSQQMQSVLAGLAIKNAGTSLAAAGAFVALAPPGSPNHVLATLNKLALIQGTDGSYQLQMLIANGSDLNVTKQVPVSVASLPNGNLSLTFQALTVNGTPDWAGNYHTYTFSGTLTFFSVQSPAAGQTYYTAAHIDFTGNYTDSGLHAPSDVVPTPPPTSVTGGVY